MNIKRKCYLFIQYLLDSNVRFYYNAKMGKYKYLPDDEYLKCMYKALMGKKLNLNQPSTFNEKLQWLKLYNRMPEYTKMVDKLAVKQYVGEIIGDEHIIPTLGVWEKFEEIDFDNLPKRFVLKCTHDSGGLIICKDKENFNIEKAKSIIEKSLNFNFYSFGREWPYKDVHKRIIAEQFMEESDGSELKDYKIHCFNGEPRFILVCSDRFTEEGLHEDFYDTDWNLMELRRPAHPNSINGSKKPDKLLEMIDYARMLAKNLPFVRIDFYEIDSWIYFGEITFFPASGFSPFEPEEWDSILGDWIDLPVKTN